MVYTYTECEEGAGQMITEQTELIRRALVHYQNKLNKLVDSEDYNSADPANDVLRLDLGTNLQRVQGTQFYVETPERSQEEMNYYRNVICCALQNYIVDLESLKKDV